MQNFREKNKRMTTRKHMIEICRIPVLMTLRTKIRTAQCDTSFA